MDTSYRVLQRRLSSTGIIYARYCAAHLPLAQSGVDLTVLMEQFLDGPEVDVDVPWRRSLGSAAAK